MVTPDQVEEVTLAVVEAFLADQVEETFPFVQVAGSPVVVPPSEVAGAYLAVAQLAVKVVLSFEEEDLENWVALGLMVPVALDHWAP